MSKLSVLSAISVNKCSNYLMSMFYHFYILFCFLTHMMDHLLLLVCIVSQTSRIFMSGIPALLYLLRSTTKILLVATEKFNKGVGL
jgi:hypothetical protein